MKHTKIKALFITKRRGPYGYLSSGLLNSVRFIVEMLNCLGQRGLNIEAKQADVIDNNDIDREVYQYKPTHCIIEAFWVVPEKFKILKELHPDVKWIVRDHSDFPFMESEGMVIEWMTDYVKCGVEIGANKPETACELGQILDAPVAYLPNYYPVSYWSSPFQHYHPPDEIHIGCFGAIRPLKNHLMQAIAAICFADKHNLRLKFYINTGRVEACGDQILKNLRALFKNRPQDELIEVGWLDHRDFIHLLEKKIDISMQVSFSETFNIVTADAVNADVPVVVSTEVYWVSPRCMADPNSIESIVETMESVCGNKRLVKENKKLLVEDGEASKAEWYEFFMGRSLELTWTECILGWCFKRFRRVS